VILVDDGSTDGTAKAAREAAERAGAAGRLAIVEAPPLEPDWTGKMWAVGQGVARAPDDAEYLLLTDADIEHDAGNLRRLVAKAETEGRQLVSLMVRLHCESPIERLLIPAFVFFFQKLYPFPRINDPRNKTAGAAGGCMLVNRETLARAGGIEAIRDRLIDDCALARRIKAEGPIWLGLSRRTRSVRAYRGLPDIWRMVARTAYTQLGHSPLALAGTVLGMAAIYLAPLATFVLALAFQAWPAAALGGAAQLLMYLAYVPTRRLYGKFGVTFLLLPFAGFLYTLMTVDSARRHWSGSGGGWKGRSYPARRGG
jgi:hopene-associated glycosyltransferase HpnB